MKVTIVDWDARPDAFDAQVEALAAHVEDEQSDLVLFPEMPFSLWLSLTDRRDAFAWARSITDHEWRLAELRARLGAPIAGSRPVLGYDGHPRNQAFLWDDGQISSEPHEKAALPLEDGYWEARWYLPGRQQTEPLLWNEAWIGFAICTELWDSAHTSRLTRAGADIILVPRATPDLGDDVWVAGVRALAVQTGCYVLSSNFAYPLSEDFVFEGLSAAAGPDGELLGLTGAAEPFVTLDVDPELARAAKSTYPRYIFA